MTRSIPFCVLALIGLLWSCGPAYEYEETLDLPETGWSYQDSLLATFHIADTNAIYNLYLELDHLTDFPYQNFYVRLRTDFPDGQQLSEQLSLELAGKGGGWLGDCNSTSCSLQIPIQQGAYFNQSGNYQLTVEQFSRRNPLPGIQSVHFMLEKTEERRQ